MNKDFSSTHPVFIDLQKKLHQLSDLTVEEIERKLCLLSALGNKLEKISNKEDIDFKIKNLFLRTMCGVWNYKISATYGGEGFNLSTKENIFLGVLFMSLLEIIADIKEAFPLFKKIIIEEEEYFLCLPAETKDTFLLHLDSLKEAGYKTKERYFTTKNKDKHE